MTTRTLWLAAMLACGCARTTMPQETEQAPAAGSGAVEVSPAELMLCQCRGASGTATFECGASVPETLEALGGCPEDALVRSCRSCRAGWSCEECAAER